MSPDRTLIDTPLLLAPACALVGGAVLADIGLASSALRGHADCIRRVGNGHEDDDAPQLMQTLGREGASKALAKQRQAHNASTRNAIARRRNQGLDHTDVWFSFGSTSSSKSLSARISASTSCKVSAG